MDPLPPDRDDSLVDTDDLFGKLDQLISRHQSSSRPGVTTVPTLTETAARPAQAPAPSIPVLEEVVQPAAPPETEPPFDRRRQLQVALYLRLRQRLDEELSGPAFAALPAAELSRIAQALRNALPGIIRESVDQVMRKS
jgi:hypothetical protein